MRILVVEDDREAAAYLTRGLKESGHIVDHAGDGEDGLHLAMAGNYDVAVEPVWRRRAIFLDPVIRNSPRDPPLSAGTSVTQRLR